MAKGDVILVTFADTTAFGTVTQVNNGFAYVNVAGKIYLIPA